MRVKGSFIKDDNMIENIDITKETSGQLLANDPEYVRLVSHISDLWDGAKNKAVYAVNAELINANWQTGQYIVEFEQVDGEWFFVLDGECNTKMTMKETLENDVDLLKPEHKCLPAKFLFFYNDITDAEKFEQAKECPYFHCVFSVDEDI